MGEGAGEAVEAVGDGYVFHYVGLVEDVCACWGDVDVYKVGVRGGGRGCVGHAFEKGADFVGGQGEPATGVYI